MLEIKNIDLGSADKNVTPPTECQTELVDVTPQAQHLWGGGAHGWPGQGQGCACCHLWDWDMASVGPGQTVQQARARGSRWGGQNFSVMDRGSGALVWVALSWRRRDTGWAMGNLDSEAGSLVSKYRMHSPHSLPSYVTCPSWPYCSICPCGVVLPVKEERRQKLQRLSHQQTKVLGSDPPAPSKMSLNDRKVSWAALSSSLQWVW